LVAPLRPLARPLLQDPLDTLRAWRYPVLIFASLIQHYSDGSHDFRLGDFLGFSDVWGMVASKSPTF
jgi:hypothetical protein